MKNIIFTFLLIICFSNSYSQIKADSIYIYYGMTQSAPEAPLMDYIKKLESSGAKTQKIKKEHIENIQLSFGKVSPKKYKSEKHKGTIYFVIVYSGGEKQYGAFDSSLDAGKFINLTTKQIMTISDKGMIDKLYYALIQIH